ncbi:hypothetical protein P7C71_g5908, partial [Lecanoromycetidae sp. Uapishka_2]
MLVTSSGGILHSIAIVLLALATVVSAMGSIAIDTSCNEYGPMMADEIALAVLDLAEGALNSLEANPLSGDSTRALRWMFGTKTDTYNPINAPQAVFGGSPSQQAVGLANLMGATTKEAAGAGDVVFFCNLSHILPQYAADGTTVTKFVDTYLGGYVGDEDPDDIPLIQACKHGTTIPTMMAAYTHKAPEDSNKPDTVIICPWYCKAGESAAYPNSASVFNDDFFLRNEAYWKNRQPDQTMTPIDYFYLMDSTILHELAHTRAAFYREDVAGPASYRRR